MKPIKWYFFKIMCEIGWKLRNFLGKYNYSMYDYWLNKIIKQTDFNLYGKYFPRLKKTFTVQEIMDCGKAIDKYYKDNPTIPLKEWIGREPTKEEKEYVAYLNKQF